MAAEKWCEILDKYNNYIKSKVWKAQELQKTNAIKYIKYITEVLRTNANLSCLQYQNWTYLKKHKFKLN